MPGTAVTTVLVHGLWHGAWCWDGVRALLGPDPPSIAVELPMTSLEDDVAAVDQALDEAPGPVLLVGHSYGGAVITAAGHHQKVRALVYVAGFALAAGESVSRLLPEAGVAPTRLGDALCPTADGTRFGLDASMARELLYGRTDDATAAAALARLRPVARSLFSTPSGPPAWTDLPTSYALCADDRCVAPGLQQAMVDRVRAAGTLRGAPEWDSDHCPMASNPGLVAGLLAESADALGREGSRA